MKEINLKDLIPTEAEIMLDGKTYTLRKINMEDEAWLLQEFGAELENILKDIKMNEISRIVYRLIKDKKDFVAREISEIDEQGIEHKKMVGGAALLHSKITGVNEKFAVYRALLTTIGISRPILDDLMGEEDQKKNQVKKTTGERSTTRSRTSTGTASKHSAA